MQKKPTQNLTKQSSPDIAIFGEVLADIFPDRTVMGGAPFNVARHLNAFKTHPVFITRTGQDALKDVLMEEFNNYGLDISGVQQDPKKPTGQVTVRLENGHPSYEILEDQAYDHIHPRMTHLAMVAMEPQLKYFGTLAQRDSHSRNALDTFINDKACPTFLDLNLREPWYNKEIVEQSLHNCDIAKMNESELATIAKMFNMNEKNEKNIANAILYQFNLTQVVVTCGEHGSWMLDKGNKVTKAKHEPLSAPLADTVGAGDAFAAVYILGLLNKWSSSLTLKRANQFASAICTVHGAVPESLSFYSQFVKKWRL